MDGCRAPILEVSGFRFATFSGLGASEILLAVLPRISRNVESLSLLSMLQRVAVRCCILDVRVKTRLSWANSQCVRGEKSLVYAPNNPEQ